MKKESEQNQTELYLNSAKTLFKKLKDIDKDRVKKERLFFLDYKYLKKYSRKLAKNLIDSPEEILTVLECELESFIPGSNARIRIKNLPNSYSVRIRDIRAKHLNKLIEIEGFIVQVSDVRPQCVTAKFECPSCGMIISVLQIEKKFREPKRCSCGRKGQFRLMSKEMVDAQRLIISEGRETDNEGHAMKPSVSLFLQEDLTDPKLNILENIGHSIKASGILKEVPVLTSRGAISTRFDIAIEANNMEIK